MGTSKDMHVDVAIWLPSEIHGFGWRRGGTKYAAVSSFTVNISSLLHTFEIVFVTVYVCDIVCASVAV